MQNYCTPHIIKQNFENFFIYRCNYLPLSQVYCVWQVIKTPTIISNNPVYNYICDKLQILLLLEKVVRIVTVNCFWELGAENDIIIIWTEAT
jgi:hypothetical protein